MKFCMVLCMIVLWLSLAGALAAATPYQASSMSGNVLSEGSMALAQIAQADEHSHESHGKSDPGLPEVKSALDHEKAGDHDHHHDSHEHQEHHKDCVICDEYWFEPWRIGDLVVPWMKVKSSKIFVVIVLLYLFGKRNQMSVLFRKAADREKKS